MAVVRNLSVLLVASLLLVVSSSASATALGDPELELAVPEIAISGKVATFTGRLHDGGLGLASHPMERVATAHAA